MWATYSAAVLDWNNAITKTEPAPGETVVDQASWRRTALPPDIGQVVPVFQGGGALGAYQTRRLSGAARCRHRAGLGDRYLHRSNKRKPDCRQRCFSSPIHLLAGPHIPLGAGSAAFYSTEPLERTLNELVDFSRVKRHATRLTVGLRTCGPVKCATSTAATRSSTRNM
jgi:hypothetical protein